MLGSLFCGGEPYINSSRRANRGIDKRCVTTRTQTIGGRVGTQRSLRVANRPARRGAETPP
jgi:hypothetical protein